MGYWNGNEREGVSGNLTDLSASAASKCTRFVSIAVSS